MLKNSSAKKSNPYKSTNKEECYRIVKSSWVDLNVDLNETCEPARDNCFVFTTISKAIRDAAGFSETCYQEQVVNFEFRIKSQRIIDGRTRTGLTPVFRTRYFFHQNYFFTQIFSYQTVCIL